MALTKGDIQLWAELDRLGVIPPNPDVLEIGEANWFGDVEPPADCKDQDGFAVAKKWYQKVLGYSSITAIDMLGTPAALKLDLNKPLPLDRQCDIIINSGTAEHVFDQAQLFRSIHERCKVGGLMIHAVPWAGWEDHGFYNYHPGFFLNLARANRYEILAEATWTCDVGIARSDGSDPEPRTWTMMHMALRKCRDQPWVTPMQQTRYPTIAEGEDSLSPGR